MSYTSLSEIWRDYDTKERKKFTARDIVAAINELPEGNPEDAQCRYEVFGFSFVGTNRKNQWGTYYGSQFTFERKDTAEEVYFPDINDITPEIIAYWEERASEVTNPLLKMRYTGLVLDFQKRITGKQPDYNTIKMANVEAIIEVVDGDYAEHEFVAMEFADRALTLALSYRDNELIQRVARVYYDAHQRFGKERMWRHIFRALINHRNALSQYEDVIVDENLNRLSTLEQEALAKGDKTDTYAHEMASQVDILCDYYHSIGKDDKIEELLDRLLIAIKMPIVVRGAMWGHGMLEQMQRRYRKYGLDNRANQLFPEIRALGIKTLNEMQSVEHTFTLERKEIEEYLKDVMTGTHEQRLVRYIIEYLPVREREIKKYKEQSKEFPLENTMSTEVFDGNGNVTSRLGAGKNSEEQKLHYFMDRKLRLESMFMHIHMEELKKSGDITVEKMMKMFDDCPLVEESHWRFLERGFEAYLNEDYLVCCHVLIPQVEAMVRLLVAINGGEVLRQGQDPAAGDEYYSLDSLLDSPVAKKYMNEDLITYFKVLFTSSAGWNLRNLFSHGLLSASSFNSTMADRVVHAIMILSMFKIKEGD